MLIEAIVKKVFISSRFNVDKLYHYYTVHTNDISLAGKVFRTCTNRAEVFVSRK